MQFFEVLHTIERDGGDARITVTPEWMQGRAVFGGLQAVLMLHAMRGLVPASLPVRTLQVTFVAPPSGNQILARATVLRQGKSATHVEARLLDGDNVLAVATGVFGAARESQAVRIPVMPEVSSESPRNFKYFPGISPTFTQYFSARWLQGGMPFSQKCEPVNIVEVSMPGEVASSEAHVLAMADFIPPVALSYLRMPVPGSSMTWMVEFLTDKVDGLSMQNWRVDAEMVAGKDGYTSQSVMLWGPEGLPIALSRQNMVVFG
jgi:acyl-coenzyme A thioesterase PaaI-like protein